MATIDRAQGSRSRTARNMDKVSAECHEGNSTQGRRSSQSEDLSAKVGCLDCKRILGPTSKSVECDNCNNWICMACSGLSDAKFDVISEDQSDMIWFCRHCRIALPGMKDILKSISQLDESHTALMGKHDALERRVEVLEKRKPEDSYLTMTKTIKEEVLVQEAIQRERKKTALIVRGIPENGKDREEIHHILATLETTDVFKQTTQPTRLGKQNERGNSRPIKIECETTEQKYMLLKRSKTLERHESTREVYIGLTRKERLANKDLREELKARRARGEEDIFIRRNEIVTVPPLLVAPPLLAAPQAAVPVAQAAAPVAQAAALQAAVPAARQQCQHQTTKHEL